MGVNEVMLKLRALACTQQAVIPSPAKLVNTLYVCVEGGVVFLEVWVREHVVFRPGCVRMIAETHFTVVMSTVWGWMSFLINKIVLTHISWRLGGR